MSQGASSSHAGDVPFRIPCPPPALRTPPPVYRVPPEAKGASSRSIPPPPLGARVPGDRIVWRPLVFSVTPSVKATLSGMENELAEIIPDFDSGHTSPDVGRGEKDAKSNRNWESYEVEEGISEEFLEALSSDSRSEEEIVEPEYEEQPEDLGARHEDSDEAIGVDDEALEESMGASTPLQQIPLASDSIQIDALSEILGIKTYEVLRDLIGLEVFAKPTDLITADTANKIAVAYGFEILPGNASKPKQVAKEKDAAGSVSRDQNTFKIKSGMVVSAGDWIRDSVHGLGRILNLHTSPGMMDRHRVWFIGNTNKGMIINNHPLRPDTLGVVDQSMVSADIRNAAPEIEQ